MLSHKLHHTRILTSDCHETIPDSLLVFGDCLFYVRSDHRPLLYHYLLAMVNIDPLGDRLAVEAATVGSVPVIAPFVYGREVGSEADDSRCLEAFAEVEGEGADGCIAAGQLTVSPVLMAINGSLYGH